MKTNRRFLPLLGLLLLSLAVPALAQVSPGNFPFLVNHPLVDVRKYGVKGDAVEFTASMTNGTSTVTASASVFAASDVGKLISVEDVGVSDTSADNSGYGTITGYTNATTVTVSFTAAQGATSVMGWFGTDDRAKIANAVTFAKARKRPLYFPTGKYAISKYIDIYQCDDLRIEGNGVASKFLYPSDDINIVTDARTTGDLAATKSCFYVSDSDRVTFKNLAFQGGHGRMVTPGTAAHVNNGCGVKSSGSADITIENCYQYYGSAIWESGALTDDIRGKLLNSRSYGARGQVWAGKFGTQIIGCHFEHPDTADYVRSGVYGASHAVYAFADRNDLLVSGCTFTAIAKEGVKCSGTASPSRNIVVTGNIFKDCEMAFLVGDDTNTSEHVNAVFSNNVCYNTLMCSVLGSRNVSITGNTSWWNEDRPAPAPAISVARYTDTGGATTTAAYPVEDVLIANNKIFVDIDGTAPSATGISNVHTYGIQVKGVGEGLAVGAGVSVHGNTITNAAVAFQFVRNVGLSCENNYAVNVGGFAYCQGNRMPRIVNNRLIAGPNGGTTAYIRVNGDSFPVIYDNYSSAGKSGGTGASVTQQMSISASGGTAAVDWPLRGKSIRFMGSDGRPEMLLAYGAKTGWVDGDTVVVSVGPTTLTYNSANETGNNFNTVAGLIADIDAIANIGAVDYGSRFATPIVTDHILIRRDTQVTTADLMNVIVTSANRTAGVVLGNHSSNYIRVYSRGEDTTSPADVGVIWSPLLGVESTVQVLADNAAAQTQLGATGYRVTGKDYYNSGSNVIAQFGAVTAAAPSTEEWRAVIN